MFRGKPEEYRNMPDTLDFNKIKVGVKQLEDAVLDLGFLSKTFSKFPYGNKNAIFKAIAERDLITLR